MKLRTYVESHPRDQRRAVRQAIADACGVTEPGVRHWCNGIRSIPARHIAAVSKSTGGKVSIEDLLGIDCTEA